MLGVQYIFEWSIWCQLAFVETLVTLKLALWMASRVERKMSLFFPVCEPIALVPSGNLMLCSLIYHTFEGFPSILLAAMVCARGVQKVLQVDYKNEHQWVELHFIFHHKVQCICNIFLLNCLCLENKSFPFVPPTMLQLLPREIYCLGSGPHIDATLDFKTDNSHWKPGQDCRQSGLVVWSHSREQLATQSHTCEPEHRHIFHTITKTLVFTALWCHKLRQTPSVNIPHRFLLIASHNLNSKLA